MKFTEFNFQYNFKDILSIHVSHSLATTHIIFCIRQFGSNTPEDDSEEFRAWVTIEYRFNYEDQSEYLRVTGPMESILPRKKAKSPPVYSRDDQRRHYFFRHLAYFMNTLEG